MFNFGKFSTALITVTTLGLSGGSSAVAYPIDCAIFLCLAGGFPSNPHCNAARAEFIRRITPFPIEPPLQLWRCPMDASAPRQSLPTEPREAIFRYQDETSKEVYQIIKAKLGELKLQNANAGNSPVEVNDYLNRIQVWHVNHNPHENQYGDCTMNGFSKLGTYSKSGAFQWENTAISAIPSWIVPNPGCDYGFIPQTRGVGIQWVDYTGKIDREVIFY